MFDKTELKQLRDEVKAGGIDYMSSAQIRHIVTNLIDTCLEAVDRVHSAEAKAKDTNNKAAQAEMTANLCVVRTDQGLARIGELLGDKASRQQRQGR